MQVWMNCEYCGEPFLVNRSRSARRRFCSRSCHTSHRNGTPEMRELSRKRLEEMRYIPEFAAAQSKAASEALRSVITDMSIPGGNGHPMPMPQRILLEVLGYPENYAEQVIPTGALKKRMDGVPRFYRVDILHPESKVVIEVDGNSHKYTEERDQTRDKTLELLGYRVLRVANRQVLSELDKVVSHINRVVASRAA